MRPVCWLCLVILLLVGCGRTSQPAGPATETPPGEAQLLGSMPALPAGETDRTASLIEPVTVPGIATFDDFGTVAYGASSVEITPAAGELAGAIYALPVNGFSYNEVYFTVDITDPAKAWFAIGDYNSGCWDLTPATTGITSVAPPYPTAHAPDGNTYFAVLAWDDTSVTMHDMSVAPNIPNWQIHVVDNDTGVSAYNGDMVLIDGHLYAVYYVYESGVVDELRLARATETVPTETAHWAKSSVADVVGLDGVDLHEVNGLPALIYSEG